MLTGKKILIVHFRVGKTDGVSLQIDAWKHILESVGAKVKLVSGPINFGADYTIGDLEQQLNPDIFTIDEQAFKKCPPFSSKTELKERILEKQESLRKDFLKVFSKEKPDYLIVSNIFSVGENLPAAGALAKAIVQAKLKTLAIHHDFYWEDSRYKHPTSAFIQKELDKYFPFKHPLIKHCTINSIAKRTLLRKKGVASTLLYDSFDYSQKAWTKSEKINALLEKHNIAKSDLFILQATRIVRRKNIELAIDLSGLVSKRKNEIKYRSNGDRFDPEKNDVLLVLAGYAEKRDTWYLKKLLRYAEEKEVQLRFIGNDIYGSASDDGTSSPEYKLWDIYPFSDLVTYPSEYEGFGNQYLEATFAQKPVIGFEYPVFKSDIKPKDFKIISLGDKVKVGSNDLAYVPKNTLEKAADKTIEILNNAEKYKKITETNFQLGKKYFSFTRTLERFEELLSNW